jgi:hypothetical protein
MPSIVTITPRKTFLEDLNVTTSPNPTPTATTVMGVGAVSLTPISAVLYSAFGQYANDAAAAAGGVAVGYLYYNTSTNLIKTRMS